MYLLTSTISPVQESTRRVVACYYKWNHFSCEIIDYQTCAFLRTVYVVNWNLQESLRLNANSNACLNNYNTLGPLSFLPTAARYEKYKCASESFILDTVNNEVQGGINS